jgi:UDP-2,3-diacylglucosamine hydrolase
VKAFFFSDLHLETGTTEAAQRFTRFLLSEPRKADLVLLGGDIFDLLVGNKALFRERFAPVIAAMKEAAARGAHVHYLEGNHDFHFASVFAGQSNIHVHTADFEVRAASGRRIFVSHGDLIDEADKGYRFLRAFTKNPLFRGFVFTLPGQAVDFIGSHSSGASRKYTTGRGENEGTDRLRKLYLEFARARTQEGFQHVLVGHSHLQDHIPIEVGNHQGEYVNLGFSADLLRYAVLEEGRKAFALREIR